MSHLYLYPSSLMCAQWLHWEGHVYKGQADTALHMTDFVHHIKLDSVTNQGASPDVT